MKREEKRIKKLVPYGLWDFTGLQTWLNQQAQAGYALEKWPGWSFIGIAYLKRTHPLSMPAIVWIPCRSGLGVVEHKKRRRIPGAGMELCRPDQPALRHLPL